VLGAAVLGLALPAAAQTEAGPELSFLSPTGHFQDLGGVVSEPVVERLNARLADFESRTGHRVHMLVLATLTGGLDRLATTVSAAAEKWGLGRDRTHAGVLFVYALDVDILHVDTLLGAEIPSVEKGISKVLGSVARLQGAGDQDGAFEHAVNGTIALLEGRKPPAPPAPRIVPPGVAEPSSAVHMADDSGEPAPAAVEGATGRATGYVVDGGGVLSPATVESLNATLHRHEQETSNQVVVHTIPSLGGETIEGYGIRLATQLQAGQKGKDNGVLLLVARDDRKVRIEVGYGLEGALPDVLCARIIREEIVPRFKQGDMDGGVAGGVDKILGAIRGEYRPTASDRTRQAFSFLPSLPEVPIQPQIAAGIFFWILSPIWLFFGPTLFSIRGKPVNLGTLPGVPFTLFVIAQYPWVLASLAILVLLFLHNEMVRRNPSTWSSGHGSSSSGSGGSWSSSSSTSSSSSSSYSGGGGSFGGGGSSGSW
jgi:uncharacterized protein